MGLVTHLTLNAPIATKVVCFSRMLKCLISLYGSQCGPRSDCSYRSSLFWVHTVCFYTSYVCNVRQSFAAGDFSKRYFQMHFFLGVLRVNKKCIRTQACFNHCVIVDNALLEYVSCISMLAPGGDSLYIVYVIHVCAYYNHNYTINRYEITVYYITMK